MGGDFSTDYHPSMDHLQDEDDYDENHMSQQPMMHSYMHMANSLPPN